MWVHPGSSTARFSSARAHEHADERPGETHPFAHLVGHEKAEVETHLIDAAAAGMQLLAHFAHDLGQAGFDVHVHVFEFLLPGEGAFLDFALHLMPGPR